LTVKADNLTVKLPNLTVKLNDQLVIAPSAKAEEMYSPEVFGRSGSDWVVVE
jgi:hypothetical protein